MTTQIASLSSYFQRRPLVMKGVPIVVFANDHVLNARRKRERKKTLEVRCREKAALRCENCGPVRVFKPIDGYAPR